MSRKSIIIITLSLIISIIGILLITYDWKYQAYKDDYITYDIVLDGRAKVYVIEEKENSHHTVFNKDILEHDKVEIIEQKEEQHLFYIYRPNDPVNTFEKITRNPISIYRIEYDGDFFQYVVRIKDLKYKIDLNENNTSVLDIEYFKEMEERGFL